MLAFRYGAMGPQCNLMVPAVVMAAVAISVAATLRLRL